MLKTKINNELKQIHELYKKNNGGTLDYIGEAYQYINGELKHTFSAGYDTTVSGVSPIQLPDSRAKNTNWKIDGQSKQQGVLPDGYTQLEYLETDGNSCINTNLMITGNESWECVFENAGSNYLTSQVLGTLNGGSAFTDKNNFSITYTAAMSPPAYAVYLDGNNGSANAAWYGGVLSDHTKQTIRYTGLNTAPTINGVAMTQLTPTTLIALTPTVGVRLFGRATTTGNGTFAQSGVRIYSFKGDTWNFIPAKNSSSVLGMYDLVTGQFFTNAGTGTFTAGPALPTPENPVDVRSVGDSGLPSGYKKLEYIESSGTQYIDTGVNTSTDTELEGKITLSALSNQMLWANNNTATNRISCYLSNTGACNFGDKTSSNNNLLTYLSTTTPSIIKENSDGIFINGTKRVNFGGGTISAGDTMYIFTAKNTGATGLDGKMYYCTIKKNNTLVRNFIPAKRSSDGVLGMYDLISDTFFTNAGTDNFIAGPEDTSCVVPVKVSGKNLIDIAESTMSASYTFKTLTSDEIAKWSNKTLTLSCYVDNIVSEIVSCWAMYVYIDSVASAGNWINQSGGRTSVTFTIPSTASNVRFICNRGGSSVTSGHSYNFQLEETSTVTSYEPYVAPTTTNITLPAPLQKIGTYKDTIESDGTLTRGVETKVLDGTESWTKRSDEGVNRYQSSICIGKPSGVPNCLSSHFKNVITYGTLLDGCFLSDASDRAVFDKEDITTVDTWKAWLAAQYQQGTPITIYYPLAEATTSTIQVPVLSTSKGTNIIGVETEIKPSNMSITYRKRTK